VDKRRAVLDAAAAWAEAIVSNDADAIGSFMTDDWVIVGADGVTRKTEFLAAVASANVTHDMMRIVGEPRVEIYGATALLTARMVNSGRFNGQDFMADEWTTDVFIRRGRKWLCALSHVTLASAQ
jgi:ketosteroid isomerase-like protein